MSRLRANQLTNENANGAPNFPHGLTVTGIVTASTLNQTPSSIVVGAAVTANSQGIDVTGVVTATSFKGDGSSLTGIDATQIATGNTKVQTVASRIDSKVANVGILTVTAAGANVTGIVTASSFSGGGLGKILQITEATYNVAVTIQGATSVTGLAGTITPTQAGSKIFIIANQQGQIRVDSDPSQVINFYLDRDVNSGGFNQIQFQMYLGGAFPTNRRSSRMTTITHLDTPSYSLGQSISYRMRAGTYTSNYGLRYIAQENNANNPSYIHLMEVAQ